MLLCKTKEVHVFSKPHDPYVGMCSIYIKDMDLDYNIIFQKIPILPGLACKCVNVLGLNFILIPQNWDLSRLMT